MKSSIFVTTTFVGFHRWLNAPDQVSFLRNFHRHIFHVRVEFPVTHDDRDLEFFIVKTKLDQYIATVIRRDDAGSCETIAQTIFDGFWMGAIRPTLVEVSEDSENGAIKSV